MDKPIIISLPPHRPQRVPREGMLVVRIPRRLEYLPHSLGSVLVHPVFWWCWAVAGGCVGRPSVSSGRNGGAAGVCMGVGWAWMGVGWVWVVIVGIWALLPVVTVAGSFGAEQVPGPIVSAAG